MLTMYAHFGRKWHHGPLWSGVDTPSGSSKHIEEVNVYCSVHVCMLPLLLALIFKWKWIGQSQCAWAIGANSLKGH